MKKIFFYSDTPIYGGAERNMHLLAKNLQSKGWNVQIICSNYDSLKEWRENMQKDGLKVVALKVSHKHDPRHFFALKKLFKQEHPDIFHLHLWNPAACRYALLAVPQNIKVVATEHDPFPLKGIKKIMKKYLFKKIDQIITVSHDNKEKMLEWYPEMKGKITTIHNGIDLQTFEKNLIHFSAQEKAKIRNTVFNAKNDDTVIVTIAALHPRKGLLYLLEAFQKVLSQKQHLQLVIAGEGPQKNELEQKARELNVYERIKFLLKQPDELIPKILKSSDLFVLPSVKEAFGLAVVEALAVGLPVVASNIGGIAEIIENRKSGLLVEPRNSKALAAALLEILENKLLREKLASFGHHRTKFFDVAAMVEKTERVYESLMSPAEPSQSPPLPDGDDIPQK